MTDGGSVRNALECSSTQRGWGGGGLGTLRASESSDKSGQAHGWKTEIGKAGKSIH